MASVVVNLSLSIHSGVVSLDSDIRIGGKVPVD